MKMLLPLCLAIAVPAAAEPLAGDRSRYNACLAQIEISPAQAVAAAQAWRVEAGGVAALHCLALARFAAHDYAAALTSFEGAAKASEAAHDGQAVAIWAQAGDAALRAEKPDAAVRYLTTALGGPGGISLSPAAEAQIRIDRARALVDLKRNADAATDLATATRIAPEVPYGLLLQATLARRMGDLKTAETAILAAAQRQPDSADVQSEAGNIAAAQGNDALARAAWLAAARASPDSPAGKAASAALTGD